MTPEQFGKARLSPFAYPHLAGDIEDQIRKDMNDLMRGEQKRRGCLPQMANDSQTTRSTKLKAERIAVIAKVMAGRGPMLLRDIAEAIGITADQARPLMLSLIESGRVNRTGANPVFYEAAQ